MNRAAVKRASWVVGALPTGSVEFRAALWLRQRQTDRWVLAQRLRGGALLALDVTDHTQGIAFFTRRYEPEVVAYIVDRLPNGGTFFDVGANVGLISCQVLRRRPGVRAFAFEAVPRNVDSLRHNARLSGVDLTVEAVAVSDHIGTVRFATSPESGWGMVSAEGDLEVPATTLDDYCAGAGIERIDVLKVDVEGSEPAVLQGARRMLEAGAIKVIVTEVHDSDRLMAMLEPLGYRVQRIPALGLRRLRGGAMHEGAFVLAK